MVTAGKTIAQPTPELALLCAYTPPTDFGSDNVSAHPALPAREVISTGGCPTTRHFKGGVDKSVRLPKHVLIEGSDKLPLHELPEIYPKNKKGLTRKRKPFF